MKTVTIYTIAEVPQELSNAWLQHLRDFDATHPGCHFQVAADAPEMPLADMIEALIIKPTLDFTQLFKRRK